MTAGTQAPTDRISDLQGPVKGQEQVNNIPTNAIQIFGVAGAVAAIPLAIITDTQNVEIVGRIKTIYIVVGTAIAESVGSQATIRLYTGLQFFAGGNGAASQLPAAGNAGDQVLLGAAGVNFGQAAGVARGLYVFTPTDIAQLQWELPWVGIEFNFISAVTAGTMAVFIATSAL